MEKGGNLTFVAEHEGHREQSVLAALSPLDLRRRQLESVDEEQREQNHVLCNLGGRQHVVDPFAELLVGLGQLGQSSGEHVWP